jgi:hypothetical protein
MASTMGEGADAVNRKGLAAGGERTEQKIDERRNGEDSTQERTGLSKNFSFSKFY